MNIINTAATEAGNDALNRCGGKGCAGVGRQAYQETLLLPGMCHTAVSPL